MILTGKTKKRANPFQDQIDMQEEYIRLPNVNNEIHTMTKKTVSNEIDALFMN